MGVMNVGSIKRWIRAQGFRDVRADRLVHTSGFLDGVELRSLGRGSNRRYLLERNQGVTGPIAVEVGYGSRMVRVRLLHGYDVLKLWDLSQDHRNDKLAALRQEFTETLDLALHEDELARSRWQEQQ